MTDNFERHTYQFKNATIVVHRPVLDEQQLGKRVHQISMALNAFGVSAERTKEEINHDNH